MRMKTLSAGILLVACLIGCTPTPPGKTAGGDAKAKKADMSEDEVTQAFVSLQSAIKAKDGDKTWTLLAKESQDDADREAKAVKEAFAKAADKDKADYEKKLELTGKELADMSGKLYVKSRRFYGKYHEIPDSKVEKVVVAGDSGTVHYIEEDGDKVKQEVVREKGQWKFVIKMPSAGEK
jgi:glucan-binding YG repeat protein